MTKTELFLRLAQPDENGRSRWVSVEEFTGRYSALRLGNGGSWCRGSSSLAKKYLIETDKSRTPGNSIDAIRLIGLNEDEQFKQGIRQDIKEFYRNKKCVMLGVNGTSENTRIEIDHKDGRKNNTRVSDPGTQRIEDFQPLCKAANDVKRQICKQCKESNRRWSAKNISGNPYDFYEGGEVYEEDLGCIGCYQYDPVEYRKQSTRRIIVEATQHTAEIIMSKLYGDSTNEGERG